MDNKSNDFMNDPKEQSWGDKSDRKNKNEDFGDFGAFGAFGNERRNMDEIEDKKPKDD